MNPIQHRLVALLAAIAAAIAACAARAPEDQSGGHVHAVMINGGGSKFINYQSHMLHVEDLLEILRSSGIPTDSVTIFSSDGEDPGSDLAVRQPAEAAELWRVRGTRLEHILRPVTFESSTVEGMTLHPATRSALAEWFAGEGAELRDGDTLVLYVTDHGEKNSKDPSNNTITLWGKNESLSVEELRVMLAALDEGVRVVMLMSQCFSGAFANLLTSDDMLPTGSVCGYFSSTQKRPAYGCYAENLGRKNVGHSFHFMQALVETGRFDLAHEKVLYTDATPDVPLRTSDVYARRLLSESAKDEGIRTDELADQLLATAWLDRGAWELEIRQLDRIGHAFGYFSPRSLAELNEQAKQLPEMSKHLRSVARAWSATQGDANTAAVTRFLEDNPDWQQRLTKEVLSQTDDSNVALTQELLSALAAHTAATPELEERLQTIHRRREEAAAAAYRMEVRLAAVLRLRNLLRGIAARVHLANSATEEQRRAHESIIACEKLALPIGDPDRVELVPAQAFPPFEEDIAAATAAVPAWMGIRFRTTRPEMIEQLGLQKGAADVLAVFPESPADKAGFEPGDIILGPPGEPFIEPNQVRSWTMLSEAGVPRTLEILRAGKLRRITLKPGPYPMEFPELPGPPKVGSVAPPLKVSSYRGNLPELGDGKPKLLVFWATWCAPCKAALPEIEAFARETGTDVIGITDQTTVELDKFFEGGNEYVDIIAVDDYRRAFLAYGVSGTPTFVLIDGDGKIASYSTGYSPEKSLGITDWTWKRAEE